MSNLTPTKKGRLSDPGMKPAMADLMRRIKADPTFARRLLQDAGIATPTGRLTRRYGG